MSTSSTISTITVILQIGIEKSTKLTETRQASVGSKKSERKAAKDKILKKKGEIWNEANATHSQIGKCRHIYLLPNEIFSILFICINAK